MKTSVKKEIFLIILETLFHDYSSEIKFDNCIQFYNFLLDTLEREMFEIPTEQDADISLCFSIIELLSGFDLMKEELINWTNKDVSEYLKDYGGLSDSEFQVSVYKFRSMYSSIKKDFLFDFS
jgi:hypothetical protein